MISHLLVEVRREVGGHRHLVRTRRLRQPTVEHDRPLDRPPHVVADERKPADLVRVLTEADELEAGDHERSDRLDLGHLAHGVPVELTLVGQHRDRGRKGSLEQAVPRRRTTARAGERAGHAGGREGDEQQEADQGAPAVAPLGGGTTVRSRSWHQCDAHILVTPGCQHDETQARWHAGTAYGASQRRAKEG